MRKRLTEESILFISVIKWVVIATIVGAVVGGSTTIFLKTLNWSIAHTRTFNYYFLLLPLGFLASAFLIKFLAPDAEGHGTEKVIEAVHKRFGRIHASVVPIKLISTVITIASGGSAGKEGPCAQIGAALASFFSDLLRFDDRDRRKLVICGISAGFASVFGTPISGAIFGLEVVFAGSILYEVLLPSFVAGITAHQVASALGIRYFHYSLNFVPVFSEGFFLKTILAGIVFGVCSLILIEALQGGKKVSGFLPTPLKEISGGLALIGLVFLFSKNYLGLGLDTLESTLKGGQVVWYAFLIKILFTTITLNFGGSGGIITPIFFTGAAAGYLFASVLHLSTSTFAAIGMVSLLAGAANTPISAGIMSIELFGPQLAPYATVACVVSFLMTGHRSVYPSQVLAIKKSSSIEVKTGGEMESVRTEFKPRKSSVAGLILKYTLILRNCLIRKKVNHK